MGPPRCFSLRGTVFDTSRQDCQPGAQGPVALHPSSPWANCPNQGWWHVPSEGRVGAGCANLNRALPRGEHARLSEDPECLRSSWAMAF